ncbi:hypothetical protein [Streptomyces sp. 7N604]|uniref:hypothetical protein n=1 Tax=Streptomyces sp. 7N604 TaxID=3457415 RepID=UPI003FD50782
MGHRYYLYGSRGMSLTELRDALELSLEASFELRDSSFKGGHYFLSRAQDFEKMTIETNWTDEEGYLAEEQFPDYSTLLYVTDPTDRVLTVLSDTSSLHRLRMEEVD